MVLIHLVLPSTPSLLERWVLVLLLHRQKALAFITSSPTLNHGIRIHVSSPYQTRAKHNLI